MKKTGLILALLFTILSLGYSRGQSGSEQPEPYTCKQFLQASSLHYLPGEERGCNDTNMSAPVATAISVRSIQTEVVDYSHRSHNRSTSSDHFFSSDKTIRVNSATATASCLLELRRVSPLFHLHDYLHFGRLNI